VNSSSGEDTAKTRSEDVVAALFLGVAAASFMVFGVSQLLRGHALAGCLGVAGGILFAILCVVKLTSSRRAAEDHRNRGRGGPLRGVLPYLAIAVGIFFAVTHLEGIVDGTGDDLALFIGGVGLAVLGVGAFFLYRWMAKRGV